MAVEKKLRRDSLVLKGSRTISEDVEELCGKDLTRGHTAPRVLFHLLLAYVGS